MSKVALITGITGQDGAYLAEYLIKKGYIVHGIKRRSSMFNTDRIDHLYQDPHVENRNLILHYGDLTDSLNLTRIIGEIQPDEIYNLAAMSHVKVSFDMSLTAQTFAGGVDMLDAYQWGDVYWQAYKNTYGTHPNSVVYGNGEKAQLQEYYFDQNGVKIKSGNTDWAKEIFGTADAELQPFSL